MPDTLRLSPITNPSIPKRNFHPPFPSFSCPRNVHLPSLQPSRAASVYLPQKPHKTPEIPSILSTTPTAISGKMLYLDSIGIDLFSLLTTHPPVVSAAVADIRAVVDFLRSSAGLTAADLRRVAGMCPEVLTSKISQLVAVFTFLLREAGVAGTDLRHVIHRRPRLLISSVENRLRPTLYFLQSIGITEINRYTSLLSCSVEQKFMPRIEYLQKLGSLTETRSRCLGGSLLYFVTALRITLSQNLIILWWKWEGI